MKSGLSYRTTYRRAPASGWGSRIRRYGRGRPDILVGDKEILEPGMVFSLEPSISPCKGVSVFFGYNIVVTETGAEILQETKRGVFEIGG